MIINKTSCRIVSYRGEATSWKSRHLRVSYGRSSRASGSFLCLSYAGARACAGRDRETPNCSESCAVYAMRKLPYPPIRRRSVMILGRRNVSSSHKLLITSERLLPFQERGHHTHFRRRASSASNARRASSASHASRICATHWSRASTFCANIFICASVRSGGAWSLLCRARAVRSSKRSSICRKVIRPPLGRVSCLTWGAVEGSGFALASALDFGRCESVAPVAVMALGALSAVEDAPLSSGARFVG